MLVKQKNQLLGKSIDKQDVFGLISDGKDTFVRSHLIKSTFAICNAF